MAIEYSLAIVMCAAIYNDIDRLSDTPSFSSAVHSPVTPSVKNWFWNVFLGFSVSQRDTQIHGAW